MSLIMVMLDICLQVLQPETDFLTTLKAAFTDLDETKKQSKTGRCKDARKNLWVENAPCPEISDAAFLSPQSDAQGQDAQSADGLDLPEIQSDDIAFIMFTSGTTINPKARCLSASLLLWGMLLRKSIDGKWGLMIKCMTLYHFSTCLPYSR